MDVRQLAFLARQPSAALQSRESFCGLPKRGLAFILANAMFWQPMLAQADGIVVNGSATTVGQAANGVPVVNIATPNGTGLSHNQFSDFNVGQQGVILNNATNNLQSTQLGGYIIGNSNLNGRAATVILNEVNGGSPSQLRGYTEVAGQGAHVILANPHGISCDGCGFINTPKVTLSTGRPILENGRLARYDVEGGAIAIEGRGLNASNVSQFELITRSARINAELHAQQLAIVTGRNEVDAGTLAAKAKAPAAGSAPQLAIDSSALGGMYAGAIKLVGTESGVGVKLAGDVAASAGDLQIDANGKLTLARAEATQGDVKLNAREVALTNTVYAARDAKVVAAGSLDIDSSLTAARNVHVEGQQITNRGNLNAGLKADGSVNRASHLQIQGGSLSNQGKVNAQGTLATDLQQLDNRNAELVADGTATLKAGVLDNRGGKVIGQQVLSLEGGRLDNRGGTFASNQALSVTVSDTVDNRDKGLILSKAEGLTLNAKNLDNRAGTLQANTGELKATATQVLDNRDGKVLTGAGAMTLVADDLRNQQGKLNAQGGKLKTSSATFDNTQGDARAENVEVTSTTRLTNDRGHLVATTGNLELKRGEILNNAGELSAGQQLTVDAGSLKNYQGNLSGKNIGLTLNGALDNGNGLIEAGETLGIDAGRLTNLNGKLRALGTQGKSRFKIGGQFNNDNGLVEVGNDRFALDSASLSNQQGTVRHLGTNGFDLSLADTGAAGGSFITNSQLNLDLADWSNTSLIQAQKLALKVGTFTQTASGKLISVDGVEASGSNWINDGSLETQGDLKLILSGTYRGNGILKSQGKMTLAAASADLGQDAQIRSGGKADFNLGSQLLNQGSLTATGDLLLKVASLTNRGTLGAGSALRIETPTLVNEGGLIFSGADMALQANSVTNNKGDIYSLGRLDIADENNRPASLIENISGTIESAHGMQLLANRLINRKEKFAFIPALTSGQLTLAFTDNCKGKHCEAYYSVTETYGTKVTEDSARANLISGAELKFTGGSFDNHFSSVSAGGDITLDSQTLNNLGAGGGEQRYAAYVIYTKDEDSYYTFYDNIAKYNAYNDPASASYNPAAMPFSSIALGSVTGSSTTQTSGAVDASLAIIQSAGKVNATGTQQVVNGSIRPGESITAGANRVAATAVDTSTQTLAQFNAQLTPDLRQQAVNPLSLPGFSLPTGQKGLFQFNSNPQHKYLIETNPAFASLNGFINSDYLLSRIGVTSDQTQRRLGDGLYEQRLIREAVIARTGQRFIAGLNSDEAMFRYLMDNAIASKTTLNLSPGIALSSAQVAALTHDIVWMEEQEVRGEKVLVPVLYLAQANNRLAPNGALIQGSDVTLISGGTLANQGTLRASANLQASGQNISNNGLMEANERLSLLATDSIRNAQGGILKGKDVSLVATQGDIINERSRTSTDTRYAGGTQHNDYLNSAARIEADNTLSLTAGNDIRNSGSVLQAGGNATLKAGRDLDIVSTEQVNSSEGRHKKTSWSQSQTTQYGSQVSVGGNLTATAGQDIKVVASTVAAQKDLSLDAGRDVAIESAANESHNSSRSKKVQSSKDQVRQQSSTVQAGANLSIKAGQDLTLVASNVKATQNVALDAAGDINVLSAKDESASFYSKKSKGSFGRSKSKQSESYDSTNIASVVEAGQNLTLNTTRKADGSMSINGGRDVTVIGSQLKAGEDLMIGATGDVAILSGVEEHGSYSKKTKSGFMGLSKSGKSQLTTTATQVGSQLEAGNDVVVAAGNDIRLRASKASAGNDVEMRAGLVNDTGDINLVSANDTAYSRSEQYKKKVGLSTSDGFLSVSSAKESGRQAQSSTSVGSHVSADRDATLKAERDINVVGSGISAGRNVSLDAGRDVNVVAAQNTTAEQDWSKNKQVGIGVSSDANGVSFFAGADSNKAKNRVEQQTAAASQISAGQDLTVKAVRDINQIGSDLKADNDINLTAGRDIRIDAARETLLTEQQREAERNGLTATLNHNYGKTKDAVNGVGKGENGVSQGSSVLKGVDAIGQFLSGPTGDAKFGNSKQSNSQQVVEQTNRSSTLNAGHDLNLNANNDVVVKGSRLDAGRDINVKGRDVTFDVAKGGVSEETQNTESWSGIHGGTSGGIKIGVGGSYGTASGDSAQGSATVTQLGAGRDINLKASNDLNLIGTQVKADRDIDLNAGNELNIRSAQNDSNVENNRHNGGGEAGLTFGSQGVGVYVSVSLGKGNLEREGERQQEAYLYAGNRLGFTSGQDTNIAGATLRGDEVVGRVGGDLNVSSVADTGKVKGKEFDISATGSFVGVSGSVGYGQTTGKTNWVEEQTSITGKSKVDIRTENHTQIDGAVIAADNGNLKLDTGTLGFSDIAGKDKEHGYYLNVGGTYGSGGTVQDGSQVGKGKEGKTGWSVEGWNYEKDREQIVRATVGAGQIVVRNDAQTGADSTAGLNRDVSKSYEITKDEEERTDLYASDSSINAVLHPVVTVQQWTEAFLNYNQTALANFNRAASALNVVVNRVDNILGRPMDARAQATAGKDLAESTLEALLLSGKSRKEAMAMMGDPAFIDGVLANLARMNGIEPKVIKDIQDVVASDKYIPNPGEVTLETTTVTEPELKALQKLNRQLSAVQAYIDEHPGSQEAVGYVMAVAQGPKGVAQFVVMQALAGTETGQTISKNIGKLQADISRMVAEGLEERPLDSKEADDRFLIGGGELITSIFTGVLPGKVPGKGNSHITVAGGKDQVPKGPAGTPATKGPCCFAAGTKVSTPQGDRAIESLKVGDVVWSKPEKGGKPFAAAILATHQRSDQPIYRLKLKNVRGTDAAEGETLLVTPSHPFYVPAKRDFIPVIDLKPGDLLQSLADGDTENTSSEVESLELYLPEGKTYNLTVDVGHTFYVGELKTWVHNTGPCDLPPDYFKGGTKGTADLNAQASLSVSKVTAPIDFDGHIIKAEVKPNGNVVGGHSTATGDVRVVPGTASSPNAQGVYTARIQVADPANPGQFLAKTNNGGFSTMFPDSWTADRIKVEVDGAFKNKTVVGNKWSGTTSSGVRVEGYLTPNTTVYPKL
ncbi:MULTISPECIES: hemagglutinin repeat-containing protein [unclassified Pseudomonas]|uniref:hemagglutinin repeat-containing protein n=1 Tax=unclassified Pseudomonas TaxID=196821 RepID=UPI001CBB093C|nr:MULTISPECIES: hemagglutinin repeat-containing protein [unclassified Pseudomonas]